MTMVQDTVDIRKRCIIGFFLTATICYAEGPAIFCEYREETINQYKLAGYDVLLVPEHKTDEAIRVVSRGLDLFRGIPINKSVNYIIVLRDIIKKDKGRIAGMAYKKYVVLTVGDGSYEFSALEIHQTLVHEISTQLWKDYGSPEFEAKFKNLNPPQFRYYGEIPKEFWGNDKDKNQIEPSAIDRSQFPDGFLSSYSKVSVSNDFSEIASFLLTGQRELWEGYKEQAIIRKKVDMVINFFETINSDMNADYFKNIKQEVLYPYLVFETEKEKGSGDKSREKPDGQLR